MVGNLRVRSYPGSADLPPFVRENLRVGGASNSDRIIISFQPKTRLVEKVYVTEHDDANAGRFRSDGTHEVGPELIRLLQNPELDLSSLLALMGYYDDLEMLPEAEELDLDRFCSGVMADDGGSLVPYSAPQRKRRKKTKSGRKQKPLREISWSLSWADPYRGKRESGPGFYGAGTSSRLSRVTFSINFDHMNVKVERFTRLMAQI